ncbi:uncharacterized protein LOC114146257 isoform X2 [Xiphophorus couchianus]|uniref:uncharacterized protein LOC114146257 isoform X2 n=1 Tax=Xiphophorus couchianus TaxID=32473 RepID=UPI001016F2A4|nr:uncharacterized protein LOC114146257 isoform X2 [Xiphophorus couchianus]
MEPGSCVVQRAVSGVQPSHLQPICHQPVFKRSLSPVLRCLSVAVHGSQRLLPLCLMSFIVSPPRFFIKKPLVHKSLRLVLLAVQVCATTCPPSNEVQLTNPHRRPFSLDLLASVPTPPGPDTHPRNQVQHQQNTSPWWISSISLNPDLQLSHTPGKEDTFKLFLQ